MPKTAAHTKYELNGEKVPSVTSIISSQLGWNKNMLIAWARKEALNGNDPTKVLTEAGNIGSITHYLIECHIANQKPDTNQYTPENVSKAENGFIAFLDWEKQYKPKYLNSELKLVSEKYRYGGTIDLIADIEGKHSLIDFKTSKGIYTDHKIQVSAYVKMYSELKQAIDNIYILKLGKEDGSFEHHTISMDTINSGWQVFLCLLELYKLQKAMEN